MSESGDPVQSEGGLALLMAGIAAILSSTCCIGPPLLPMLGLSGAWIGNLTQIEPYRPFFVGAAIAALFFAWRGIWRPAALNGLDEMHALPQREPAYRWVFAMVAVLTLLALMFPWLAPVFS